MLVEETTVPAEALPIEAFKAHLRLGTGFADDAVQDPVLDSFLRAALAAIEARTGKILLSRVFSWTLTAWRDAQGQALPVAPVGAITDVTFYDGMEQATALPQNHYSLARDHHRPRLVPTGAQLPAVPRAGRVEITFDAGFADDFADLPADLAQAVLMLAAHYYENRSETGLTDGAFPLGVAVLIERYKTVRILTGARA